jgi:hypothetical protein
MPRQPPPRPFGPVLHFRGAEPAWWRLSALVGGVNDVPPPLIAEEGEVAPLRIGSRGGYAVWRYDFALARATAGRTATYRLDARTFTIAIPGGGRLHFGFTSCNGHEDADLGQPNDLPDRNAMWARLAGVHARDPLHLLLQGGDQLYADPVWQVVPALRKLLNRFTVASPSDRFEPATAAEVDDYFFQRYTELYAQPEMAGVLASVPSLMMWDDHDIYDGYGSHPPAWQRSAVHRGVFAAAARHFRLFQLGLAEDETAPAFYSGDRTHFGWSHRIDDIGIVAPDLRSTRTFERVMSDHAWREFESLLETMRDCRTLVLISTVPIVNADVGLAERLFSILPASVQYRNDLRDQWQSPAHRDEWRRMLALLLDLAERSGVRVLVLSGEIHLAAAGTARRGEAVLRQLISSGIAHPPLGRFATRLLDRFAAGRWRLPDGIVLEMLRLAAGRIYKADRNWLELDLATAAPPVARWHFERDPEPTTLSCGSDGADPRAV